MLKGREVVAKLFNRALTRGFVSWAACAAERAATLEAMRAVAETVINRGKRAAFNTLVGVLEAGLKFQQARRMVVLREARGALLGWARHGRNRRKLISSLRRLTQRELTRGWMRWVGDWREAHEVLNAANAKAQGFIGRAMNYQLARGWNSMREAWTASYSCASCCGASPTRARSACGGGSSLRASSRSSCASCARPTRPSPTAPSSASSSRGAGSSPAGTWSSSASPRSWARWSTPSSAAGRATCAGGSRRRRPASRSSRRAASGSARAGSSAGTTTRISPPHWRRGSARTSCARRLPSSPRGPPTAEALPTGPARRARRRARRGGRPRVGGGGALRSRRPPVADVRGGGGLRRLATAAHFAATAGVFTGLAVRHSSQALAKWAFREYRFAVRIIVEERMGGLFWERGRIQFGFTLWARQMRQHKIMTSKGASAAFHFFGRLTNLVFFGGASSAATGRTAASASSRRSCTSRGRSRPRSSTRGTTTPSTSAGGSGRTAGLMRHWLSLERNVYCVGRLRLRATRPPPARRRQVPRRREARPRPLPQGVGCARGRDGPRGRLARPRPARDAARRRAPVARVAGGRQRDDPPRAVLGAPPGRRVEAPAAAPLAGLCAAERAARRRRRQHLDQEAQGQPQLGARAGRPTRSRGSRASATWRSPSSSLAPPRSSGRGRCGPSAASSPTRPCAVCSSRWPPTPTGSPPAACDLAGQGARAPTTCARCAAPTTRTRTLSSSGSSRAGRASSASGSGARTSARTFCASS